MTYKCKVVACPDPILVYYKEDGFVNGKLTHGKFGTAYFGDDGKIYPALLDGKGNWIVVIQPTYKEPLYC